LANIKSFRLKNLTAKQIMITAMSVFFCGALLSVTFGNHLYCIKDGKRSVVVMTMKTEMSDIFEAAGIRFSENDEVKRSGVGGLYTELTVMRAFNVTVSADGKQQTLKLTHGLVPDALDAAGITLDSNDIINVSTYTPLSDGLNIKVDRVEYVDKVVTEVIPYETETYKKGNMPKGEKVWLRYGVNGERTINITSKYVNGVLDSEAETSSEVTIAPVLEVLWIGTGTDIPAEKPSTGSESSASSSEGAKGSSGSGSGKGSSGSSGSGSSKGSGSSDSSKGSGGSSDSSKGSSSSDSGEGSGGSDSGSSGNTFRDSDGKMVSYKKLFEGNCTAYTYTPGGHNITASGLPAGYGRVGVRPSMIPYGTRMYITSPDGKWNYGYCVAADTGNFANSSILIDLFYDSYNTCIQFGIRQMKIYILD
jgi:uncharacterized protein YabE (DUF348 family)/3D (Asp-Asp-Asp) domain-containing protein